MTLNFRVAGSDHQEKGIILMMLIFFISGCTTPTKPPNDWRAANVHKILIVCIQGDSESNRKIEDQVVPILQHQGLDAIPSEKLFAVYSKISPHGLATRLRAAQIDGIMELTYSGKPPKWGLPSGARFKYHSFKGSAVKYSSRQGTLDNALTTLIAGVEK